MRFAEGPCDVLVTGYSAFPLRFRSSRAHSICYNNTDTLPYNLGFLDPVIRPHCVNDTFTRHKAQASLRASPYGVRQPPALKIWRWCRRRFCRSPFTSPSPHLANALFFVRAALFLFLCLPVVRIRPPFPYLSGARLISFHLQHACTLADELRSAFTATVVDGDERIHVTSPLQPPTLQAR